MHTCIYIYFFYNAYARVIVHIHIWHRFFVCLYIIIHAYICTSRDMHIYFELQLAYMHVFVHLFKLSHAHFYAIASVYIMHLICMQCKWNSNSKWKCLNIEYICITYTSLSWIIYKKLNMRTHMHAHIVRVYTRYYSNSCN